MCFALGAKQRFNGALHRCIGRDLWHSGNVLRSISEIAIRSDVLSWMVACRKHFHLHLGGGWDMDRRAGDSWVDNAPCSHAMDCILGACGWVCNRGRPGGVSPPASGLIDGAGVSLPNQPSELIFRQRHHTQPSNHHKRRIPKQRIRLDLRKRLGMLDLLACLDLH